MNFITEQQVAALKSLVLADAYTVGFNATAIEGLSVVKRTRAGEKRSFNEKPRNSPCVSVGMDSGTERQLGPVCFL